MHGCVASAFPDCAGKPRVAKKPGLGSKLFYSFLLAPGPVSRICLGKQSKVKIPLAYGRSSPRISRRVCARVGVRRCGCNLRAAPGALALPAAVGRAPCKLAPRISEESPRGPRNSRTALTLLFIDSAVRLRSRAPCGCARRWLRAREVVFARDCARARLLLRAVVFARGCTRVRLLSPRVDGAVRGAFSCGLTFARACSQACIHPGPLPFAWARAVVPLHRHTLPLALRAFVCACACVPLWWRALSLACGCVGVRLRWSALVMACGRVGVRLS